MAKRSAVDQLVERINADIDRRTDARGYAVKHGAIGSVTEGMDADIAELYRIRDYVTGDGEASGKPAKASRPKGSGKRGLPKSEPMPPAAHEQ